MTRLLLSLACAFALRAETDWHSLADLGQARTVHSRLDLHVDFDRKVLSGTVTHRLDRPVTTLTLDTRDLVIEKAGCGASPATFQLAEPDPIRGQALVITLPKPCKNVTITYRTSPKSTGLHWLTPAMTAGKKLPFLASQSWSIHARSWVPLQDTPRIRFTYDARITVPPGMLALMSAANPTLKKSDGRYAFRMPQPIPPQLLALAVGDLAFRPLGKRTGVYADPTLADLAAREFAEAESMVAAAETICGPYRWQRFDILLLPPGATYGGVENPRLTFIADSVLAGDKSLVGTIAHELAHSWSGNLVTNATWSDIWISEGFTTYLTNRIQEAIYGPRRAQLEYLMAVRALERALETMETDRQIVHAKSIGKHPDRLLGPIPYAKASLFLHSLEAQVGRATLDAFLRRLFQQNAWHSFTTEEMVAKLEPLHPARQQEWLEQPGLPAYPDHGMEAIEEQIEARAEQWRTGAVLPAPTADPRETVLLLQELQDEPGKVRLDRLAVSIDSSPMVLQAFLKLAMQQNDLAFQPLLGQTLRHTRMSRGSLASLARQAAKLPDWRPVVQQWFQESRSQLHPSTLKAVEDVLK